MIASARMCSIISDEDLNLLSGRVFQDLDYEFFLLENCLMKVFVNF